MTKETARNTTSTRTNIRVDTIRAKALQTDTHDSRGIVGFVRLGLFVALVSIGCGEPSHVLRVDLRTDFAADTELVRTVTILSSEDRVELQRDERPVEAGLVDGVRIAQFDDVPSGTHRVSVQLHGERGMLVERLTVVDVREDTAVTVIATRDCRDVACDLLTTCASGQCVDPTCSPETPERCPEPECESAADCMAGSECATPVCLAGACGLVASNEACEGRTCDVATGCESACMGEELAVAFAFDDLQSHAGDRTLELFEAAALDLASTSPCGAALRLGPGRGWGDVANDAELQAIWEGNYSMMAWVRSAQLPAVAVYPHILSKEQNSSPRRGANLILHGHPDMLLDTVLFEAWDEPDLFQVRGSAVNDDTWHHVAGVREGNALEVFIDGVFIDQRTTATGSFDEDLPLRIGAKSRFGGDAPAVGSWFEGSIDEVRVYSRAVTRDEVTRLHAEQSAGRCACP